EVLLPAVAHLEDKIRDGVANWRYKPEIVSGLAAKYAAFRRAHAALAASGTVSLELALSGVPMVVAYRVDWFFRRLKELNRVLKLANFDSFVLPNIILGNKAIPEFLDEEVQAAVLANHLKLLLQGSPERTIQLSELARLDDLMRLPDGHSQRDAAADVVLGTMRK
ncbi:MAG: lipid-A-disaccharide synthase, partial [Pseudomonadota bacterium]